MGRRWNWLSLCVFFFFSLSIFLFSLNKQRWLDPKDRLVQVLVLFTSANCALVTLSVTFLVQGYALEGFFQPPIPVLSAAGSLSLRQGPSYGPARVCIQTSLSQTSLAFSLVFFLHWRHFHWAPNTLHVFHSYI